jgi:hypothetical protein
MSKLISLGMVLLAAVPVLPQAANPGSDDASAATNVEDRMLTPPPVSGQAYPVALDSEEHTNSLHYGVVFSSAYSDNVLASTNGHPVSDVNYSVWPTIGLDKTTSRLHWDLTYAPGFTFYQRTSARNEGDQTALLSFQYRLSPHVTFSARDTFQKSSSVFNQPNLAAGSVFDGAQGPNESVVAPLADRLANFGNVGITYQYSANDMMGAGGTFSNLHYADTKQVTGLWDSSSQAASVFYTHRLSKQHYVGAAYQYRRLMSYPGGVDAETQAHSVFLFYTVYPNRRLSISFFGGPQHSDTVQPAVDSLEYPAFSLRSWSPAGGASLDWEGHFVSAALSYSHIVSEGGGLIGAVKLDSVSGSVRLQLTRALSASVSGSYANNNVLGHAVGTTNGHTNSGSAGLERKLGEHFSVQLGYTRLHQTYSVPAIAGAPNTNREFISFSYLFARPLGR